ncbi:putative white-collar-1b protein [Blakeslea trispora]|nr:putative white-collar-1b protein [Blakeslea trispora]
MTNTQQINNTPRSISQAPSQRFLPPTSPTMNSQIENGSRYSGMYANTGFDMLSLLSRVVNRPNQQIDLGPVDLSCSFVVVDAKQYDFPIVYVSPSFERLTDYAPHEVIGRNCRFLQAPDGRVAIGSRRKYTDNSTVYHIKTHMVQGKESQSSIINYRKTGQPFVNLLTVIPISWESSDEIDYFVGLQVDLVEQPNSIFQSMKDGTYSVNYRNSAIPPSISSMQMNPEFSGEAVEVWKRPSSPKQMMGSSSTTTSAIPTNTNNNDTMQIGLSIEKETTNNHHPGHRSSDPDPSMDVETLIKEASTDEGKYRRCWHELLLDQSPDFIHVLTIKGIFLYCSDSTQQVLEYDPSELIGKSLKDICHPSDITTVMRELKQSSSDSAEPVNLIYRVRRKNSGYMWIESCGKLRNEDGRGRKYVVLSGRERPVYQLPRNALTVGNRAHDMRTPAETLMPGTEDHEFWGKLSTDGLLLYASWTCANILGSPPSDIVGTSLYHRMRSNRTTDLTRALAEVKEGKIVYLRHALVNNADLEVMVATTFYPDGRVSLEDPPSFVLMQTKVIDDESTLTDDEPVFVSMDPDVKKKGRADISLSTTGSTTSLRSNTERMIDELDITRDANWQYELHQLRISNKKLRDDLAILLQRAKQEGNEEVAHCHSCYRRLPGTSELSEFSMDEPLLCNTCSLRELPNTLATQQS